MITDNGREVVSNDLVLTEDGTYKIDFADFEQKIIANGIKLFLLCSPHNPVGRVWTKEELEKIGDICVKHGVTVVSDEIHNDFIWEGTHTVFAGIKKEFADISVTCTSPSKTFNLASMLISNIFIPNQILRRKFRKEMDRAGISQLSVLGLVATEAAYVHGDEWYAAMKNYVSMIDTQGTYLIWLDFRQTGLTVEQLDHKIIYEAGLWLDSGKIFGKTGEGFERINVACPRAVLQEALDRIRGILE